MGKANIVSGGDGGRYFADLVKDVSRIAERKTDIANTILNLRERLTEIDTSAISAKQSEVNAQQSSVNSLIEEIDDSEESIKAVADACEQLAILNGELGKLSNEKEQIEAQITELEKERTLLDSANELERVEIYCSDYSEKLKGTVSTIEIPGTTKQVAIRPAFSDYARYDSERDGLLQPALSGTPASVFFNLAMEPGWKRWCPFYRSGVIEDIDYTNDTCSVRIDEEAQGQRLVFNYPTARALLENVPIEYMQCNSFAFYEGDRVIVEFNRQAVTSGVLDLQPEKVWYSNNTKVIGFVEKPESCDVAGSFIFTPTSDDAEFGWGEPYEIDGTPVNPPLGTVLTGLNGCIENDKRPNRLYDHISDTVVHGSNAVAGKRWWKRGDYVITWQAPYHIENTADCASVWRNGYRLAYGPQGRSDLSPFALYWIMAAGIREIGGIVYLFVLGDTMRLYRAPVDPTGINQELEWETFDLIDDVDFTYAPLLSFATAVYADFNPDCTKLVVVHPGRIIEYDISVWNSPTLLEDNWFQRNTAVEEIIEKRAEGGLSSEYDTTSTKKWITVPISSGYLQSGERADIEAQFFEHEYNHPENIDLRFDFLRLTVKWRGRIVKEMDLKRIEYYKDDYYPFRSWPNLAPHQVCPKTGTIYINWQTEWLGIDATYQDHHHEIYKGTKLIAEKFNRVDHWYITEGADPSLFNYCDKLNPSAYPSRDRCIYPQYGCSPCYWLDVIPGTSYKSTPRRTSLPMMQVYAGELLGKFYEPDTADDAFPTIEEGSFLMDELRGHPLEPRFNYTRQAALATHPNGAFVFSIRTIKTSYENSDEFDWWNVCYKVPDLITKADLEGANPRLIPVYQGQDCSRFVVWQSIGVLYVSNQNPWA